ncbi:MAG TPA: DNA/RNA nuclease SfsA [Firmicutes bacterium]|mgnify:CR=1 FL=1|nr:DNA/RNA nuclease SfsA [Bacillota bacterium]
MKWVPGTFVRRLNRFVAEVEAPADNFAHVPSSGRMRELLLPGSNVLLKDKGVGEWKYRYQLCFVQTGSLWVSIDSLLPNRLVAQALQNRWSLGLPPYSSFRREVSFEGSRFDFLLEGPQPVVVEVKSVTLVEAGWAMFPDAPTERGVKHLRELIQLRGKGYLCFVLFVVQREDAQRFKPNEGAHREFAEVLREARACGVELRAYDCRVTPPEVSLRREIPVDF